MKYYLIKFEWNPFVNLKNPYHRESGFRLVKAKNYEKACNEISKRELAKYINTFGLKAFEENTHFTFQNLTIE